MSTEPLKRGEASGVVQKLIQKQDIWKTIWIENFLKTHEQSYLLTNKKKRLIVYRCYRWVGHLSYNLRGFYRSFRILSVQEFIH